METKKIKVIVTKIGLDGHDRGLKVVATILRDAGLEVIYLGKFQMPEDIVKAAIQEDVDVIGISCQSPTHILLIPQLINLLKENNIDDILVVAGGIIPEPYCSQLKSGGVHQIFGPNTPSKEIVDYITSNVRPRS
jgi:methylmalonyl-CoA mutase, C-terminal domain